MEKTIENIKKIFHRGPKKKKVIGDGTSDGKTQEVNEKVLTSRVELKKTAEVVGTNKYVKTCLMNDLIVFELCNLCNFF